GLLQDADDLLFRKLLPLHLSVPFRGRTLAPTGGKNGGHVTLDMSDWHTCDTTHCRAGWVVALAGEEGKALEDRIGTPAAASLIYLASDPQIGRFPDFYCGNDAALEDMRAAADAEAARSGAVA
ncbi:hypothetical protein, partial [Sphingomonas sp. Leaf32]